MAKSFQILNQWQHNLSRISLVYSKEGKKKVAVVRSAKYGQAFMDGQDLGEILQNSPIKT